MYVKRNRGEARRVILRLEMLEDRRLLSGGLLQPLLSAPLPLLLLRLPPSEVAAILQQGKTSLSLTAGASNPGGVTANAVAAAQVAGAASINLALTTNLLQPGASLLTFAASGWGTSGTGALINFGARGSINPSQGINGGGGANVGLFDFSKDFAVGLGGNQGPGFGEDMFLPGAGAANGSGINSLAIPDLFTTGQSSLGSESGKTDLSDSPGFDSPTEPETGAVQVSGAAGSDGGSLSPQADDLQDPSSNFGRVGIMFQRLLDQVGDFGQGLSNRLGEFSWVTWSMMIAAVAAAYVVLRRKGRSALQATSKETVEPWWFPGLR
jgi:hypothetical protein